MNTLKSLEGLGIKSADVPQSEKWASLARWSRKHAIRCRDKRSDDFIVRIMDRAEMRAQAVIAARLAIRSGIPLRRVWEVEA